MLVKNFPVLAASLLAGALAGALIAAPVAARELATVKAERVGMSTERLGRVSELMQHYVDEGRVAGIHTVIARSGKVVFDEVLGSRGVDDATALAADDLYRIYSMSKPITVVAAMQLYEQGRFQLSDPISKFVPELTDLTVLNDTGEREPAKGAITMHQLLTHTAGFSYGFDPSDPVDQLYRKSAALGAENLDDFAKVLADLPLKFQPGSQWHYSVAVDVTGLIVERLSGQPFDEYLAEHIFAPLGMTDTFFSVPDEKFERFLPNHRWDAKKNTLVSLGEPAMERFQNVTMYSGGGGLVGSTADYVKFTEMLRNGGSYNGSRLLSPKTLQYMTNNHLPAVLDTAGGNGGSGEQPTLGGRAFNGFGFGLGFGLVTDPAASGVLSSVGEYYWGGAAGTVFWVDPQEDLIVVSMIQLMGSPWPLRSELKVAVNQALISSQL